MKHLIRWVTTLSLTIFTMMASAERLEVFRWQANSSSPEGLVQGMMAAAKIHEKYGATVGIYRMDVGSSGYPTFDYALRWDSGEDWAKTKQTNFNEEWQAFWSQASQSPSGTLLWSLEGINWNDAVKASILPRMGLIGFTCGNPTPANPPQSMRPLRRLPNSTLRWAPR